VNYRRQLKFLSNLVEENGALIDRKLNVALTRARKKLIVVGVVDVLNENPIYMQFISRYYSSDLDEIS
jgi:superfamily I DNA and/or RNA helicase